MHKGKLNIYTKRLSGSTLVELLIVMIISGILFLLLFDGLNMVRQYSRMLDRRLSEKSNLLYSHQVMEMLFERTDSILPEEGRLFFYTRTNALVEQLSIEENKLILHGAGYADTLFYGLTDVEYRLATSTSRRIDSLFLSTPIGKDTVTLDYGLAPYWELATDD